MVTSAKRLVRNQALVLLKSLTCNDQIFLLKKTFFTSFFFIFTCLISLSSHSASKTILVLGDSLSAEYGLPRGTGWVPLLQKKLQAANRPFNVVNASISGDTTSGGLSRLPATLAKNDSAVVVIELGGNDALRGLSLAATEVNLRSMIDTAKKTGAKVLLLGMQIPPNYGPDYTRRFAAIYTKLSKEKQVALVPFFLEGFQTRPDLFQPDRIHPVAAAQPLMLANVWQVLEPMLKTLEPVATSKEKPH
jgi:acyl-CoA thioesterase-1